MTRFSKHLPQDSSFAGIGWLPDNLALFKNCQLCAFIAALHPASHIYENAKSEILYLSPPGASRDVCFYIKWDKTHAAKEWGWSSLKRIHLYERVWRWKCFKLKLRFFTTCVVNAPQLWTDVQNCTKQAICAVRKLKRPIKIDEIELG